MTAASKHEKGTQSLGRNPTRINTNRRDLNISTRRLPLTGSLRYLLLVSLVTIAISANENRESSPANVTTNVPLFNDVHFHLTNYVQEGMTARRYFEIVGDRVGRVAMFGIPLQQKRDVFVSGERAPDEDLLSDAALYDDSFVDAARAMEYASLSDAQKARVDPTISSFNTSEIYAADYIHPSCTTLIPRCFLRHW